MVAAFFGTTLYLRRDVGLPCEAVLYGGLLNYGTSFSISQISLYP